MNYMQSLSLLPLLFFRAPILLILVVWAFDPPSSVFYI